MQKKIVSLLLVACMMLSLVPALALNLFAAEETYETSFSETSNYPVVDTTAGTASFTGNWSVGSLAVTATKINDTDFAPLTFGTAFTPYTYIEKTGCGAIVDAAKSTWGSQGSTGLGGGFGVNHDNHPGYKNMMLMGVNYNSVSPSSERTVQNMYATVSVRYVAEYSGTVDITFDIGYAQPNGTTLTVLQNGVVIGTFDYGTATGTIEDVAVNMGDIIDFAATPDLNYDYDSYEAAGYTAAFDYGKGKRGLIVNELAVTFDAGYYVPDIGMGELNADIVHNLSTNVNTFDRFFFTWYNASGEKVKVESEQLTGDCYAVINPYLIENGIVAETDTYKEAMEKYRVWLKTTSKIEYNGNWSVGENWAGEYGAYLYPSWLDQANPYAVRHASSGTKPVVDGFASSRWVSERQFDKMFDSFYDATWQHTATQNATIPTATTKVGDIRITYSDSLSTKGAAQGNGMAYAPTSIGAAGGIEGECFNNETKAFFARPGTNATAIGNLQAGAIVYTAPATGLLKFDVHAVNFVASNKVDTANLDTKMAIFINGVQKTAWTTVSNKNGENPADTVDAMLAPLGEIIVYAGDTVEFTFVRGASGGTHVNMSIEAFLDTSKLPVVFKSGDNVLMQVIANKGDALPELEGYDSFGSSGYIVNGQYTTELPTIVEEGLLIEDFFINTSASIAISGDFILNVYVDGAETATAAGIIVEGVIMPGVKQADGTYKIELAAINAGDLLDAEYTYYAYQYHNDGTYRLSKKATTVNTGDMLDAYVDGETDEATKNMADAIRDYAYMANMYFANGTLAAQDPIKNELKGALTIKGNYDSGMYDVMLATLKKYSMDYDPKYTNKNYADANGNLPAFVDSEYIFPANKVEWGFGDQNPTDAAFKYNINGVTLNLAENVGFAIKIAANGNNDVAALADGFQVKVTVGNGIVHYYDAFVYVDETKSEVAVVVDGVPAGFFDQDYTFTVVDADGNAVSATYTYSVLAWLVNEYQFGNGSVKMYLVRALYRMGLMAEEYIHG